MITRLIVIVLLLGSCFQVPAWSGGGHMVIAAEAYHQLSTELKVKVSELLKAHPDYDKCILASL